MIYGYARVSSANQERYGNGLEAQEEQLRREGAMEVLTEAMTGTTMDRPVWDALIASLQPGDTLMVAKLDRIARTSSKGFEAVKELLDRGVKVHILNMGLVDNTPTGRLVLNVMFAFAEFERDMIVARTQEGKAVARQREGYREGRRRIDSDHSALLEAVEMESRGEIDRHEAAELAGLSLRTYQRRRRELLAV